MSHFFKVFLLCLCFVYSAPSAAISIQEFEKKLDIKTSIVDIIVLNDVLNKLTYGNARRMLNICKQSQSKYLLVSFQPTITRNSNLSRESWRPLNVLLSPFCFPQPLMVFEDQERTFGVWRLSDISPNRSAVAYIYNGSRLGDNLVNYMHAKWISYNWNIPLLYTPFPYSDQLMMHEIDRPLISDETEYFEKQITLRKGDSLDIKPDASTLYMIPYFPESLQEYERPHNYPYFVVDWNNENFVKELRKTIKPRYAIEPFKLPNDRISVAVHVRIRANGFDAPGRPSHQPAPAQDYWDWPFKLVHNQFFIDHINKLYLMAGKQPLYVYIFTDEQNPESLVRDYQTKINNPDITFDYRKTTTNRHDLNVLEDLFGMTQFDALIRPDSNFSLVASKLSYDQVCISPKHYYIDKILGHPMIDEALIKIPPTSKVKIKNPIPHN